jgi:hypothetical protein
MAHVLPARLGFYMSGPRRSRPAWSWRLIAGADFASGIGMLLIGIAASGLAGAVALTLGCLVLVEAGCLTARLRTRTVSADRNDRPQ